MMKIRFQGKEWLFVGDSLEEGGAITTPEWYEDGIVSYAHLSPDGIVRRYHEEIGTIEDIQVIDSNPPPVSMNDRGRDRMITGDTWEPK